jgi:hypothetical protein
MSAELNEVQKQVLDECVKKIGEHFDAFVLIAEVQGEGGSDVYSTHAGGYFTAIGLLAHAQNSYLNGKGDMGE